MSRSSNTSRTSRLQVHKMPTAIQTAPTVESLRALFPLTFPIPTPTSQEDLVSTRELHREEDLLRNPNSFRTWWTAIQTTKEAASALHKTEGPLDLSPDVAALLGHLASPNSRKSLQRLTYLYEAALANFPGSFKLWKSYLQTRMSYVLGRLVTKKRAGGRKKFPEMREALEDEKEDLEQWEGGLDGVVGWEEWKSLVATFERALMWLPRVRITCHARETSSHYAYRCPGCGCSTSLFSTTHSARPKYHIPMPVEHMTAP